MVQLLVVFLAMVLILCSGSAYAVEFSKEGAAAELLDLIDRNELYHSQPEFKPQERHLQGVIAEHHDAFEGEDVAQYGINILKTANNDNTAMLRVRSGLSQLSGKAVAGVQILVSW